MRAEIFTKSEKEDSERKLRRPTGVTVLALFFAFGMLMSGLTATMLLLPGSVLEAMWRLNPGAREGLSALGVWAVLLMAVVSVACATAAVGLWRCTRWGYWTALGILTANLAGDAFNGFVVGDRRTLIGLPIGGAMIWYLIAKRAVLRR